MTQILKDRDLELRFTPYAWAKMLYMRDKTRNEVGAFGITDEHDLLLVRDIVLPKQTVGPASVKFDDESVADFFEDQVEAGRRPDQFARIWIHTHPGMSCTPSGVDEATFKDVFGSCDWSAMVIIGTNDDVYCRLVMDSGPIRRCVLPTDIDYTTTFDGTNEESWKEEYEGNVETQVFNYAARFNHRGKLGGVARVNGSQFQQQGQRGFYDQGYGYGYDDIYGVHYDEEEKEVDDPADNVIIAENEEKAIEDYDLMEPDEQEEFMNMTITERIARYGY